MKLGFYLFAEYINMFISSVVMATLFFGGYDIPFVNEANWGQSLVGWISWIWSIDDKGIVFYFCVYVDTLDHPAFRYDQLMNLGWKALIPLALLNMVITAVVVLLLNK